MDYDPRVITPYRVGRRTYNVGPRGAPVIGYRPKLLVAETPNVGRASRLGRKFHQVLNQNLKRLWIWPQCHYDTCNKRFAYFKTRYSHEFIRFYEIDHTILGMLTRTSWNVVRKAVCDSLPPLTKRRRPSYDSPDPNTIRSLHKHEESLKRCKRRKRQRKRRHGRHFRNPAVRDELLQRATPVPSRTVRDTISDNFAIRERRNQDYVWPSNMMGPPPPRVEVPARVPEIGTSNLPYSPNAGYPPPKKDPGPSIPPVGRYNHAYRCVMGCNAQFDRFLSLMEHHKNHALENKAKRDNPPQ